jgi:hypothetical protein
MQVVANTFETILGIALLILAPLMMLAFWSHVTEIALMGGW